MLCTCKLLVQRKRPGGRYSGLLLNNYASQAGMRRPENVENKPHLSAFTPLCSISDELVNTVLGHRFWTLSIRWATFVVAVRREKNSLVVFKGVFQKVG